MDHVTLPERSVIESPVIDQYNTWVSESRNKTSPNYSGYNPKKGHQPLQLSLSVTAVWNIEGMIDCQLLFHTGWWLTYPSEK